jgi:hypothetical protein
LQALLAGEYNDASDPLKHDFVYYRTWRIPHFFICRPNSFLYLRSYWKIPPITWRIPRNNYIRLLYVRPCLAGAWRNPPCRSTRRYGDAARSTCIHPPRFIMIHIKWSSCRWLIGWKHGGGWRASLTGS